MHGAFPSGLHSEQITVQTLFRGRSCMHIRPLLKPRASPHTCLAARSSLLVHFTLRIIFLGWLGSRVVSVLDSVTEGPVQITVATLSGNSLRQTVRTHCASVHQAAKLVAALLRVAGVTAGLAESNGSLPPKKVGGVAQW